MNSWSRPQGGGQQTTHKRASFTVEDMVQLSNQERQEQLAAQIAVFSCDVALTATRVGLRNHMRSLREKPKTRYDFMQKRKRDFRVGKVKKEDPNAIEFYLQGDDDALDTHGKSPYFLLQTDPSPFVRHFEHSVFEQTMKQLNRKLPNFRYIEKLNLADQLLGDERLIQLCEAIRKGFRVTHLNLAGNRIRDAGLRFLSSMIRGLHQLQDLNLARNEFSDKALGAFFHPDCYSPSLQCLDLTFNRIGPVGAYYVGTMFERKRVTALHTLRLGGRFGQTEWGDEFMKVLTNAMLIHDISRLRSLSIADAGLRSVGIDCISLLLVCDAVQLQHLNISRNAIATRKTKFNFINALRMNRTLKQLFVRETGLTRAEINLAQFALQQQLPVRASISDQHTSTAVEMKPIDESAASATSSALSVPQQAQAAATATAAATAALGMGGGSTVPVNLSWPERLGLAYNATFALNECKQSYHKVMLNSIPNVNPWKIPKPAVWTVVRCKFDSNLFTNYASIYRYSLSNKRMLTAAKQLSFGRLRAMPLKELRDFVERSGSGGDGGGRGAAAGADAILSASVGVGERSYRRMKALDMETRQLEVLKEAAFLSETMSVDPRAVTRTDMPLSLDGETAVATDAAIGGDLSTSVDAADNHSVASASVRSTSSVATSSKRQRIANAIEAARRASAGPRAVKGGNKNNLKIIEQETNGIEVNIRRAAAELEHRTAALEGAKQALFETLHAFLYHRTIPMIDLTASSNTARALADAHAAAVAAVDTVATGTAERGFDYAGSSTDEATADGSASLLAATDVDMDDEHDDGGSYEEGEDGEEGEGQEEGFMGASGAASPAAESKAVSARKAAEQRQKKQQQELKLQQQRQKLQQEKQFVPECLAMAMEDYHSAMIEQSYTYAALIGSYYQQKLLYLCIVQEQTTNPFGKFDFGFFMRRSVPCYQNLQAAMAFMQYFFINFTKEREDHESRAAKVLQQLVASSGADGETGAGADLNSLSNEVHQRMQQQVQQQIQQQMQTMLPSEMSAKARSAAKKERKRLQRLQKKNALASREQQREGDDASLNGSVEGTPRTPSNTVLPKRRSNIMYKSGF